MKTFLITIWAGTGRGAFFVLPVVPHCLALASIASNLVPRAHVPFGQHQDKELWKSSGIINKLVPRALSFAFKI